jgi:hypothetical protein
MIAVMNADTSTHEELAKMLCDLQQANTISAVTTTTRTTKGAMQAAAAVSTAMTAASVISTQPSSSSMATYIHPSENHFEQAMANSSHCSSSTHMMLPDKGSSSSASTIPVATRHTSIPSYSSTSNDVISDLPKRVSVEYSSTPNSPNHYDDTFRHASLAAAVLAMSSSSLTASTTDSTWQQPAPNTSFPVKLYEMMEDSAIFGFEAIVSWQPPVPGTSNGHDTNDNINFAIRSFSTSFKVHSPQRFVQEVMPKYFRQTKFKSFQRQLNIYNFQRVHDGPNRGGYYHPCFIRNAPHLLKLIGRKRIVTIDGARNDGASPFLAESIGKEDASAAAVATLVGALPKSQPQQQISRSDGVMNTNQRSFTIANSTNPLLSMMSQSSADPNSAVSSLLLDVIPSAACGAPSDTSAAAGISTTSNFVDQQHQHQYLLALCRAASTNEEERQRMFQQSLLLLSAANTAGISSSSNAPRQSPLSGSPPPSTNVLFLPSLPEQPTGNGAETSAASNDNNDIPSPVSAATTTNQHVFPWKLHKMLEEAPAKNFNHIVSWVQNGTAFKVHNSQGFLANVIYQYFDQSKYESFRRQLNLYGFTRVVRGQHRGVYSHPFFRQGHQELCRFITRQLPSQSQQQQQQQKQQQLKDDGERTTAASAVSAVGDTDNRNNNGNDRTDAEAHDTVADFTIINNKSLFHEVQPQGPPLQSPSSTNDTTNV